MAKKTIPRADGAGCWASVYPTFLMTYDDNLLAGGGSSNGIAIGDMTFTGVERFIFTDATYSLSALQALT